MAFFGRGFREEIINLGGAGDFANFGLDQYGQFSSFPAMDYAGAGATGARGIMDGIDVGGPFFYPEPDKYSFTGKNLYTQYVLMFFGSVRFRTNTIFHITETNNYFRTFSIKSFSAFKIERNTFPSFYR